MNNFYNLTVTELSSAVIVLNIIFSLILQMAIVWSYKKTHKGLSYSPSFIFTLVIVGLLGTVVMMVVQNNLVGAFALLGAFSLIRFRTILKETRDIAFVFFALVIGIAIGTNNYTIALISTALIILIMLGFYRFDFGKITNGIGFILTFNAKDSFDIEKVNSVLSKYAKTYSLLQMRSYGIGVNTYVFSLRPKNDKDSVSIVNSLKEREEVSNVEIITGEHSVEY